MCPTPYPRMSSEKDTDARVTTAVAGLPCRARPLRDAENDGPAGARLDATNTAWTRASDGRVRSPCGGDWPQPAPDGGAADHMAKACGSSSQRAVIAAFPWLSAANVNEIDREISHRVVEMANRVNVRARRWGTSHR